MPLVIIGDFDFVGISVLPPETDSVLIVDPDAVLSGPVASETLQAVSGRYLELPEVANPVQLRQLAIDHRPNGDRASSPNSATFHAVEEVFRGVIGEGSYHDPYYNVRRGMSQG
jgi:hypothetical protein